MLKSVKQFLRKQDYLYSISSKFRARGLEKRFFSLFNHYYSMQKAGDEYSPTRFPVFNLPEKNKKEWGNLVIYFIDDNEAYTVRNMEPALRQAGALFKPDWHKWVGMNVESSEWPQAVKKANSRLLEHIRDCHSKNKIDCIIAACYGQTLLISTLQELRKLKIPTVRFWMDDKQNMHQHLGGKIGRIGDCPKVRLFDLHWTTTKVCVNWIEQEGSKAIYLAEGANPKLFFLQPGTESIYDVSFVGSCCGIRSNFVKRLHKAGIKVACFGPGWQTGKVAWEDIAKIINQSRINLGIGELGQTFNLTSLKTRDFQVPMAGGFYLTTYNYELADWYDIGRHIACYRNIDEAIEMIRFYLRNESLMNQIRHAGHKLANAEHTWSERFKTVFRALGILGG